MFLEELQLKLFKGFQDFRLSFYPFSPFACLVGPNNGGKTSVLQAIQLLFEIVRYAFGNGERPDFSDPRWHSDPKRSISRIGVTETETLWLEKKTSVPCVLTTKFREQNNQSIFISLTVEGPSRYTLDLQIDGKSLRKHPFPEEDRWLVEEIFSWRPIYILPVGAVLPQENFLDYPNTSNCIEQGRLFQCWRSRLYWLYEENKDEWNKVVNWIQRYLSKVKIRPPKLSHDGPPRVFIEFEESGVIFDINASGGGLRTLLNIGTILYLSNSKCLLFDEPDAHLHSSLQRSVARMLVDFAEEHNTQVIVASHAPDFIAEIPVESIFWIDRTRQKAEQANEVGRVLVELGAISNADAVRAYGADKVLFVEGKLDRRILAYLFGLAGYGKPFEDNTVVIAPLPTGKGDITHITSFPRFLSSTFKLEVKVACIVDCDYAPDTAPSKEGNVLVLPLKRKEIENYLLDPQLLVEVCKKKNEEKSQRIGKPIETPGKEKVEEMISSVLEDFKKEISYQLVPSYRASLPPNLDNSTKEREASKWFEEQWKDPQWRISHCPGKEVLKRIRQKIQKEFKITLTNRVLCEAVQECPQDIKEIARQIDQYFYGTSES